MKKTKKKRLSPHFITSTTWGQVVPVSTSGLSEDALWEKKFELAAGKKKIQQRQWRFTMKDFRLKPLWGRGGRGRVGEGGGEEGAIRVLDGYRTTLVPD